MDKVKRVDYVIALDYKLASYCETVDGGFHWTHITADGVITTLIEKEMEELMADGLLMDGKEFLNFVDDSRAKAKALLKRVENDLLGEPVIMFSPNGDEHMFILEEIDYEDFMLLGSNVYAPGAADPVFAMGMLPFELCEEIELMTTAQKGEWVDAIIDESGEFVDFSEFFNTLTSDGVEDKKAVKKADVKLKKPKADVRDDTKRLPKNYQPELVNADMTPQELARRLKIAMAKEDKPDAITIILSGIPGTGKSLSVAYIAKQLGIPVHSHKVSDLVDKWVGSSGKAIAKAFDDAQKAGAILLLDEVDSISTSRSGGESASADHQVQTVNALLQSIDDYEGVLFCTTNSTDRMDTAIKRRMLLEITVSNLTDSQADKMAKIFFPRRKIKGLEADRYAPADFSKVKDGLLFTDDSEINKAYLLKKLKQAADTRNGVLEADKNKGKIGFLS